jgi:hypothetical protein
LNENDYRDQFPGPEKVSQGKVRDIHDLGGHLLIVAQ